MLIESREEDGKSGNSTKRANSGSSAHPNTTYTSIQMNPEEYDRQDVGRDGGLDFEGPLNELSKSLETTSPPTAREQGFLIDTVGSGAAIDTGRMPPVLRSSSPSTSSSCDEVVLFIGRNRTKGRRASQVKSIKGFATGPDTQGKFLVDSQAIKDRVTNLNPVTSDTVRATALSVRSLEENVIFRQPVAAHRRLERTESNGQRKQKVQKPTSMVGPKDSMQAEDASLADYITNISDGVHENASFATTPIRGQGIPAEGTGTSRRKTDSPTSKLLVKSNSTLTSGWTISDIEDLQDLSTSEDDFGDIQAVISKRERPSGLQYLVVCEGYTIDDARWIRDTSLESPSALEQVRLYNAEKQLQIHCSADDSDTSLLSDSERDQMFDTDGELEGLRDEEDLLRRRIDRMADEKIARLLAKQEELGMGSNEVMLFDDDFADDVNESDESNAEHISFTPKDSGSVHNQKRGGKRSKGVFHQATALTNLLDQDSYSGFDVMDHDRPSLKTRPMGRQGTRAYDVSDTELQLSLTSAWHKDRLKKQAKKQEREELRAQGLLGKQNRNKADLQAKYLEGMTMEQIKNEIRGFIFSSNERYPG